MTDKELLELAAKAAGIKIDKSTSNGGGMSNTGFDVAGNAVLDWHNFKWWNPLTNDGDALRLAVQLRLVIQSGKHPGDGCTAQYQHDGIASCTVFRDDPAEQTRRAIVMAAAEVGSLK